MAEGLFESVKNCTMRVLGDLEYCRQMPLVYAAGRRAWGWSVRGLLVFSQILGVLLMTSVSFLVCFKQRRGKSRGWRDLESCVRRSDYGTEAS